MRLFRLLSRMRMYLLSALEAALSTVSFITAIYAINPDAAFYFEYEDGVKQVANVAITYAIVSYLLDFYREVRVRSRLVLVLQFVQLIGSILVVESALAFINRD